MTGQIHDRVIYEGIEYDLISVNGEGLFEPSTYGMFPKMLHTACWRGFYCTYTIEQLDLFLTSLTIRTNDEQYPPIDGKSPSDDGYRTMRYINLRLPMLFRGKLLLGADFIRERYVHMGFQAPEAYQKVVEATFLAGKLISMQDCSTDFFKK
jgi:hypothetical protein